eukprot:1152332-Pelagomonas_calceolata.AAC.20
MFEHLLTGRVRPEVTFAHMASKTEGYSGPAKERATQVGTGGTQMVRRGAQRYTGGHLCANGQGHQREGYSGGHTVVLRWQVRLHMDTVVVTSVHMTSKTEGFSGEDTDILGLVNLACQVFFFSVWTTLGVHKIRLNAACRLVALSMGAHCKLLSSNRCSVFPASGTHARARTHTHIHTHAHTHTHVQADKLDALAGSDVVLVAKEAAMRPLRRLMAQLDCLDDEPHSNPQQAQAAQDDVHRNVASKVDHACAVAAEQGDELMNGMASSQAWCQRPCHAFLGMRGRAEKHQCQCHELDLIDNAVHSQNKDERVSLVSKPGLHETVTIMWLLICCGSRFILRHTV